MRRGDEISFETYAAFIFVTTGAHWPALRKIVADVIPYLGRNSNMTYEMAGRRTLVELIEYANGISECIQAENGD